MAQFFSIFLENKVTIGTDIANWHQHTTCTKARLLIGVNIQAVTFLGFNLRDLE